MELEKIEKEEINEKLKRSFLNYAMSVIIARALPDIRDGLKPVQRRILYGMNQMNVYANSQHKKSARIVGDVMGKYHPHGDSSIYEAMVRMAQNFSYRYMLVDGHGNFGNIDGDGAAAMRYTEARMSKISMEMLRDIDKKTVNFVDNYDGTEQEPEVLPAHIPNLLVNGSTGIAVGMATNIPPHNLSEVIDGLIALIHNPEIEITELMDYIKGPDFPTGGLIVGLSGIRRGYKTGQGSAMMRAKVDFETSKSGKTSIVVKELPYTVNKTRLLERIAELAKNKIIDGITDLRDESNRNGIRIVIELRKDIVAEVVLNNLYKHSQLQQNFSINMICLVDGTPRLVTIKEMLAEYLKFQVEVLTRKTEFELDKALKRLHILAGYIIAQDHIDEIIQIIKQTDDGTEKEKLIARFNLSDIQAQAILDMQLRRLSGLNREKIKTEKETLEAAVEDYNDVLTREERKYEIIETELIEIRTKYGDDRKTEIIASDEIDIADEDLIPVEDVIVTVTEQGYAKRMPLDNYKVQSRGGIGRSGMKTKEDDDVKNIIATSTHDYLYIFTNKGRVYSIKAYQIPEASYNAKGLPLINIVNFQEDEQICTITRILREITTENYLFFTTKLGLVKKTKMTEFTSVKSNGKIAITLREDDELFNVFETNGNNDIVIGTSEGKAIRFSEEDVRPLSRVASGVIGIRMPKGATIVGSALLAEHKNEILVISENGYGKRSLEEDYRKQGRGGQGVKTMNITNKNGKMIMLETVKDDSDLIVTTDKGMVIRMHINDISLTSRNTQGVIVVRLKDEQKITNIAIIDREEEEEEKVLS